MLQDKIAYITSCFGSLSHTFIRREIAALRAGGLNVKLYGIRPDVSEHLSDHEKKLIAGAVYLYPLSLWRIIRAHWFFIIYSPQRYFRTARRAVFNEERQPLPHLKLLYHFLICADLAHSMHHRRIKHIHAHFMNVSTTIAMYCSGLLGISFSFTNHTEQVASLKWMIGLREKIRSARFICTISETSLEHLEGIEPCREKSQVLRAGLDLKDYPFFAPPAGPSSRAPVRLLAVGRMIEVKGFEVLLRAMALLQKRQRDVKLTLIGDGPLRESLDDLARSLGVKHNVSFAGSRPQKEIRKAYQEHDLLVVPSIETRQGVKEGLPVVILEAMASGLPVVASGYSGILEVVEDQKTGLLAAPGDEAGIADAVEKFLADPSLRELCSKNAHEKVKKEFDIKKIVKKKIRLFQEVLS